VLSLLQKRNLLSSIEPAQKINPGTADATITIPPARHRSDPAGKKLINGTKREKKSAKKKRKIR
jgi:hypothetical protein